MKPVNKMQHSNWIAKLETSFLKTIKYMRFEANELFMEKPL